MKGMFPLYGAAQVPIRIAPVKVMSEAEIKREMAKEPAHMDKPTEMEMSEFYKLKSRERREKYYAQGLNAKGEPSRRLVGRPVGTNNSMWRDAIAKAKAGDPDAITLIVDEFERRMDTAKFAYGKRRDARYDKGLTANGMDRKQK